MRYEVDGNLIEIHYDSTSDLRESSKTESPQNAGRIVEDRRYFVSGSGDIRSWLGCRSYDEVDKLTGQGWPEGLRRMEQNIKAVEVPAPTSVRRKKIRADFGDEIDIHRVYGGDLETAWSTTTRHPISSVRDVTLYVNLSASANKTADQLFWKGAAAIVLVDALELAGYSVRVIGYDYSLGSFCGGGINDNLITIVLKEAGQPLDKESLAAAVGLSGYLRKYIFQATYNMPYEATSGLGAPRNYDWKPETGNELVVHVTQVWTQEAAQALVTRVVGQLEEQLKY